MQFKFSLQPIISILYIFLGIILPPCFCCTGEYKYLFQISFVSSFWCRFLKTMTRTAHATCWSKQIIFKQTIRFI